MTHRGPRKQRFPGAGGMSSNTSDRRRAETRPRPVTPPTMDEVYDMLQAGVMRIAGTNRYISIRHDFPLSRYTQSTLDCAFAEARECDAQYVVRDDPLNFEVTYFEIRDAMLAIAYDNVRAIADRIEPKRSMWD